MSDFKSIERANLYTATGDELGEGMRHGNGPRSHRQFTKARSEKKKNGEVFLPSKQRAFAVKMEQDTQIPSSELTYNLYF